MALKKIYIYTLTIVSIFFFQAFSFAEQKPHTEQITITTYYPSPYGSYNQLNVAGGGLRLGKVVDNVQEGVWTEVDIISSYSAGLFIVTVVPKDGSSISTSEILFSADAQNIGLQLVGNSASSNLKIEKNQDMKSIEIAKFRAQYLQEKDLFSLRIMTNKECTVYIGKILSFWLNENIKR